MTLIRWPLSRRIRSQIADAVKASQAEQQRHPKEELPAKIPVPDRGPMSDLPDCRVRKQHVAMRHSPRLRERVVKTPQIGPRARDG
jgi:hypothetical protein